MTPVITRQSAENMAYVRGLLRRKQPGFSAALELALALAEIEFIGSCGSRRCLSVRAEGQ
jgi:hypothetical protein